MVKTPSTMLALGTFTPSFALPEVTSGDTISLDTFAERTALLVMFIGPQCPFVKHVQEELARLGREYLGQSLGIVAIGANDAGEFPGDGPDGLREMARDLGFVFPVCFDDSQGTAKAFAAACTPDFFLFDQDRRLVYRGQLDSTRPGRLSPTGADLRAAIDAVLAGQPVSAKQVPSLGCNIKWKSGNEPDYFPSRA